MCGLYKAKLFLAGSHKTFLENMSEYDEDTDDSDVTDSFRDSFASLSKIKSNTPRARFDVHFYPTFIQLIQFSAQKQVSNRYEICKDNVSAMLRLPYSNDKQIFFVLHLKHPIVGGNKSTTDYDFVVFNFADTDNEEVSLELTNPNVRDMFDEETVESGCIAGKTVDVFETLLVKIFAKDVTTPAKNYDGRSAARALQCTFWDNNEHFLYPLDDGFVNVWKYCQKLNLKEVKNVRFVRSQGRCKTFDFYIYPVMQRAIRRYHTGLGKSNFIDCFYLEFKAIDQDHYDGLFAYCEKNKISISTNDFRSSASDTGSGSDSDSNDESESQTQTEPNASESDVAGGQLFDDDFEAPDPYMAQCQTEGRRSESDTSSEGNASTTTSEDEDLDETPTSREPDDNSSTQRRRRKRSRNVITDETDSSSSDSVKITPRKRSLRIDSGDGLPHDIQNKIVDVSESD